MTATTARLDAIEAQLGTITPGPWHLDRDEPGDVASIVAYQRNDGITVGTYVADTVEVDADSAFIAAAPDTIRELLTLAREQAAALERVEAEVDGELQDAEPSNYEEDNYDAGYIAGLTFAQDLLRAAIRAVWSAS